MTELKEIEKYTISVGDFNTPLSGIYRTTKRISKGIEDLYNTINQQDLINVYGTLHQITAESIYFQVPQEIYQNRPYPGP